MTRYSRILHDIQRKVTDLPPRHIGGRTAFSPSHTTASTDTESKPKCPHCSDKGCDMCVWERRWWKSHIYG